MPRGPCSWLEARPLARDGSGAQRDFVVDGGLGWHDRRDIAAAGQARAVQEADRRMTEHNRVNRWISDLLASAIVGALGGLLLDLLASWIAPKYWGPASWGVAVAGAVGGMLSRFTLRRYRQSENSK